MKKGPEVISSGVVDFIEARDGNVFLSSCELGGRDATKHVLQEENSAETRIDPNFKYFQGSSLFSWYQPKEAVDFNLNSL
ncbi:MAG: hypothetical protein A2W22_00405 [Candidatus Levybacteria bacterium RBG_16_35_11]|nr:MAG: hypothetical protein A2W22_00405 [Candidatus Levybacteria bacterium RBG_16_35_11]